MKSPTRFSSGIVFAIAVIILTLSPALADEKRWKSIDFNREIRPILSNACFACHGPDSSKRKGVHKPLRLDTEEGAFADLGGYAAIVKGKPTESELITRIISDDSSEVMPPPKHAKKLGPHELEVLTEWIKQGAPYAKHWSYVRPVRPTLPSVKNRSWPQNPIDRFILARLESEVLTPSPEADRFALIRRLSLDLTGLPPTVEEADAFVRDNAPNAYERLVDRLLAKPAYGEHWGRLWLDLARYADSAGYADDPPRIIWAYRDYVIRSFQNNKPFDIFTIEQLAGDLLPSPSDDELIATAFHRNTLTNNEGGTNDEEFRNVAVVDRANTTMAVWMGTTLACAQCHAHKYDPISQTEYFRFFAILNNTQDADMRDESPLLPLFSEAQSRQKATWGEEIAGLATSLKNPPPEVRASQIEWEKRYTAGLSWTIAEPKTAIAKSGAKFKTLGDHSFLAENPAKNDTYALTFSTTPGRLSAIRLETFAYDSIDGKPASNSSGPFAIADIRAHAIPPAGGAIRAGRYVRLEIPGKAKMLSLAEVQVFQAETNLALKGEATQSSTDYNGPAKLAIDGKTDGKFAEAQSTTHTAISVDPWWEVDLKTSQVIDRIVLWNRTDPGVEARLSDFKITLFDENRKVIWAQAIAKPPMPNLTISTSGIRPISVKLATADASMPEFAAGNLVDTFKKLQDLKKTRSLVLIPTAPIDLEPGATVSLTIEQHTTTKPPAFCRFRVSTTSDARLTEYASIPESIASLLKIELGLRSKEQTAELSNYYLNSVSPTLNKIRERIAALTSQSASIKPETTVPICRELSQGSRRVTKVQRRGNFMDLGEEVNEGIPAAFGSLPAGEPVNRLTLARWLVGRENPLTARVIANRYWEQIFGIGLVTTSEEFGAQGNQPSHADLLDWLAVELIDSRWDLKQFLRILVTSSAYRQTSKVTPEIFQRDPENRLLGRGPRVRLSAEMVRDQALAASGLLSPKMFGPPVKPPQPSLGLNAAFGSAVDWETSKGEDRFRRGLYTTWRRSSPYPSMTTFDAPNRETCTLKRTRTNTPLQALVTMNDPVYVEAAQALARKMNATGGSTADKTTAGFRLVLTRIPTEAEVTRLVHLFERSRAVFANDTARAKQLATEPIGPAPKDANLADLASWTVVGNVLLNLDEMLLKR